ncbi:glycosyltransferase [Georgenia sp. SUBG003]|uniref:glycosyltransferase family protein n=1 Tax=Georgenia sp. SUBG003 TaxID=1497974 RepID=UPI0006936C59
MSGHEPRLLIYSQDGLGLGHMRRTTLLAREFLRRLPGASALTMSDSPLGQFFTTAPGHDYLKLPSIRKDGPGRWSAVSLSSSFQEVLRLRTEVIASTIASYDPHVLLVDHMPHGAMGELLPALRGLDGRRPRVVLGLRDIIDAPETVRRRWAAEGAYDALEEFYDEVLVYGSRDVYDVAAEYSWPAASAARLTYCGYVCAPAHHRARAVAGALWRRDEGPPRVLVLAGGGADAFPMFDAVLSSVPDVRAQTGAEFFLVTGPFMPERDVRELKRRALDLPATEVRRKIHGGGRVARADLVVSMAGYNTTGELLGAGTPALLVPRRGPSAEQRTRARLFAERGWVHRVDPDLLGPGSMSEAIVTGLTEPPRADTAPDLGGRAVAAIHLMAGIGAASTPALETLAT